MSASDDVEGKTPSLTLKACGEAAGISEYQEYQRLNALFTDDRLKVLVRKIEYVDS